MSLAAKSLSRIAIDMKTMRYTEELPTDEIPLLQEIAFVKQKQQILSYLDNLRLNEEKLFKELKVRF